MPKLPVRPRGAKVPRPSTEPTAGRSRGLHEPEPRRAGPRARKRSHAGHRPASVDDALLLHQELFVRRMLLRFGVAPADLDDVTQEVLLGAWRAVRAGRFRPRDEHALAGSLRVWLCGIAFRQASHYRNVAYRRRELPVPDFRSATGTEGSYGLHGQLAARCLLRKLRSLSPELQEVLVLAAGGATANEIAEVLRIPLMTAASKIRRGRAVYARALKRWWKP